MNVSELFDYMNTPKYKNYTRNREIFEERSAGIFRSSVKARVKLELMGAGAIVRNDQVFAGWGGSSAEYANIDDLIVPNNLLSAITSTYISFATTGKPMFDTGVGGAKESAYLLGKVKTAIKEQSIGGSCLLKVVEHEGQPYINIFNAISYYAVKDDNIQDINKAYVIFTKESSSDGVDIYLTERHEGTTVTYRRVKRKKDSSAQNGVGYTYSFIDTELEGMTVKEDENGYKYSVETLKKPAVAEVSNETFSGSSDYTDDNIALMRELVVLATINSQTFDKIANPLISVPEDAIELDENGIAKLNLQDRTIIVGTSHTGATGKVEQISLESKIDQTQKHKENLEGQIFSSLAVNTIALGIGGGNLSGIALQFMLGNVSTRVIEKRNSVAKALKEVANITAVFDDPIPEDLKEKVATVKTAVDGGFMSTKEACNRIGNQADYAQIIKEREAELGGGYTGFDDVTDPNSSAESEVTAG